jgi:hypothetical protein
VGSPARPLTAAELHDIKIEVLKPARRRSRSHEEEKTAETAKTAKKYF